LARRHGDFGPVTRLLADAVGRPGQRAFRVLIEGEQGSACLWVERGQLEALAMLIEQLLTGWPATQVRSAAASEQERSSGATSFPAKPDVEFRVGQLALGFEERSSLYVLLAHTVDSDAGEEADFTCLATRAQLRALSEGIPTLLAAGRPRCPTCEQPLGTGQHRCPRANGHVRGVES
jgi:uncharacterized repeat protein (TIGR03847 family)